MKFSDIVLPVTTSLERDDIGSGSHDGFMIAMRQQIPALAEAQDDYTIFCALAKKLGFYDAFSEGRTAADWLPHLYESSRERAQEDGVELPLLTPSGRRENWSSPRPLSHKFFWPISAQIRNNSRFLLRREKLSFIQTPWPVSAIGSARAFPSGMKKRPLISNSIPGSGLCTCFPASHAPDCTASTIMAA